MPSCRCPIATDHCASILFSADTDLMEDLSGLTVVSFYVQVFLSLLHHTTRQITCTPQHTTHSGRTRNTCCNTHQSHLCQEANYPPCFDNVVNGVTALDGVFALRTFVYDRFLAEQYRICPSSRRRRPLIVSTKGSLPRTRYVRPSSARPSKWNLRSDRLQLGNFSNHVVNHKLTDSLSGRFFLLPNHSFAREQRDCRCFPSCGSAQVLHHKLDDLWLALILRSAIFRDDPPGSIATREVHDLRTSRHGRPLHSWLTYP